MFRRRRIRVGLLASICVTLPCMGTRPLSGQSLSVGFSTQYARGDYIFAEATESWMWLPSLSLSTDRIRVGLGTPILLQDSRAVSWIQDVPVPTGGPDHGVVTRRQDGREIPMQPRGGGGPGGGGPGASSVRVAPWSPPPGKPSPRQADTPQDAVEAPGDLRVEVGDPAVAVGVEIWRGDGTVASIELLGRVKIPASDVDAGVGTGEWDGGGGIGLTLRAGRALVFGDVTWWWYGDMPELRLEDGPAASLGVGLPVGERFSALLSAWVAESIVGQADPPASIGGLVSLRLSDRHSVNAGVSVGLSESSPDAALSLGWRWTKDFNHEEER